MHPIRRHEGDSWDLATSVGATATLVAAARAVASSTDFRLIDDAFAGPLVSAVGIEFLRRWVDGELDDAEEKVTKVLHAFVEMMAVRTRYFDGFLLDAAAIGIRQVVNLASGLDTRGYRLSWPPGTTIFEIDRSQVIEFKTTTLAELGATPAADLRAIPIDLRGDWPAALHGAGFGRNRPTAWIAEGVLPFLPSDAQDRLLDTVTGHSAAGSRLGAEVFVPPTRQMMQPITQHWRDHGFGVEVADLVYQGDRHDVARYLDDRGWRVVTASMNRLRAENGLAALAAQELFADNRYYTASYTSVTAANRD